MAQFDLAACYDRVPTLMCARSLEAAGASPALMGAVVRQQLVSRVSLAMCAGGVVEVPRRTSGALTGSRVAGRIGRWPVEQAIRAALRTRRCWAGTCRVAPHSCSPRMWTTSTASGTQRARPL